MQPIMELKEMIKVMQHFEDGGVIEIKERFENDTKWGLCEYPYFNWYTFKYRIKQQKQKVTIEKWLMQSIIDKEYRIIETSSVNKVVNFKKLKLIESYEVEL